HRRWCYRTYCDRQVSRFKHKLPARTCPDCHDSSTGSKRRRNNKYLRDTAGCSDNLSSSDNVSSSDCFAVGCSNHVTRSNCFGQQLILTGRNGENSGCPAKSLV